MTSKGRHAEGDSKGFYRDLLLMILGIVVVGGFVFFLLVLFADGPTTTTSTTAVAAETTSTPGGATSTTSAPATTTTTELMTTTTTVPVREPAEVRVVVLNSIGVAGAAGRMTARLEDAGYQTLPADDFEPEQDPSRIWYRSGFSAEANELLLFMADASIEPLTDDGLQPGADIVMVLGTGYEE